VIEWTATNGWITALALWRHQIMAQAARELFSREDAVAVARILRHFLAEPSGRNETVSASFTPKLDFRQSLQLDRICRRGCVIRSSWSFKTRRIDERIHMERR
jgi:hypothetical protein